MSARGQQERDESTETARRVRELTDKAFELWMESKYGHLNFTGWDRYHEWLLGELPDAKAN